MGPRRLEGGVGGDGARAPLGAPACPGSWERAREGPEPCHSFTVSIFGICQGMSWQHLNQP